ncbi:SUN domain-containing protein 3-like [Solea solea]|uniref:SUN domain-containing protein 3-like n=1 Tax=Solea solea TaxID=90069 RepID=UPI00272A9E0C|nr:SUN domain-containing protein 3-like [Solea solea]
MPRRSSRLLSLGYYNSDEALDQSNKAKITYREKPVKVFKRKPRTLRARPFSTIYSNTPSPSQEQVITEGQSVELTQASVSKWTMRTFGLSLIITGLINMFLFNTVFTFPNCPMCHGHNMPPVENPADVLAVVEARMQHLFAEMQQENEHLLSQMKRMEFEMCKDTRPMADKMPDFALESQGARVMTDRSSKTYHSETLFGFPIWNTRNGPYTVIQGEPVLLPGKCWAFNGSQGTLVISLSHPVQITHVTLDHLPRFLSPTGRIHSAPKDFEVYGIKSDSVEKTLLGIFTYDENGVSTQTYKLPDPTDDFYKLVELRVLSNWGHVQYTCLYRFRVHGEIDTSTFPLNESSSYYF